MQVYVPRVLRPAVHDLQTHFVTMHEQRSHENCLQDRTRNKQATILTDTLTTNNRIIAIITPSSRISRSMGNATTPSCRKISAILTRPPKSDTSGHTPGPWAASVFHDRMEIEQKSRTS
jgi:hypothetical protein